MPSITVADHEAIELALRRFKHSCERAGIISEVRRRQYYEKPTTVRRRKAQVAANKQRRRSRKDQHRLVRLY